MIKFANMIIEEITKKDKIQPPNGSISGECFEKWLRRPKTPQKSKINKQK